MQFRDELEFPTIWALVFSELKKAQTHPSVLVECVSVLRAAVLDGCTRSMAVQQGKLDLQGTLKTRVWAEAASRLKPRLGTSNEGGGPGAGSSLTAQQQGQAPCPESRGGSNLLTPGAAERERPGLEDCGCQSGSLRLCPCLCMSLGSPGVSSCLCPCV